MLLCRLHACTFEHCVFCSVKHRIFVQSYWIASKYPSVNKWYCHRVGLSMPAQVTMQVILLNLSFTQHFKWHCLTQKSVLVLMLIKKSELTWSYTWYFQNCLTMTSRWQQQTFGNWQHWKNCTSSWISYNIKSWLQKSENRQVASKLSPWFTIIKTSPFTRLSVLEVNVQCQHCLFRCMHASVIVCSVDSALHQLSINFCIPGCLLTFLSTSLITDAQTPKLPMQVIFKSFLHDVNSMSLIFCYNNLQHGYFCEESIHL